MEMQSSPTQAGPRRRWVDQREAAEYLGVTDRTIRRFIAEGRLPGYRLGNKMLRLDVADLDALMRPIPAGGGRIA